MERGELLLNEAQLGLRHEMFAEQIRMLDHRALERLKDDTAFFQLLGENFALDQVFTVGENQPSGVLLDAA